MYVFHGQTGFVSWASGDHLPIYTQVCTTATPGRQSASNSGRSEWKDNVFVNVISKLFHNLKTPCTCLTWSHGQHPFDFFFYIMLWMWCPIKIPLNTSISKLKPVNRLLFFLNKNSNFAFSCKFPKWAQNMFSFCLSIVIYHHCLSPLSNGVL